MKEQNCILSGNDKTFHPIPDTEERQKWKLCHKLKRTMELIEIGFGNSGARNKE